MYIIQVLGIDDATSRKILIHEFASFEVLICLLWIIVVILLRGFVIGVLIILSAIVSIVNLIVIVVVIRVLSDSGNT